MVLIQDSQNSFESEVCGVKWRRFYNKTVNKLNKISLHIRS